jgi:hypothetical protein
MQRKAEKVNEGKIERKGRLINKTNKGREIQRHKESINKTK